PRRADERSRAAEQALRVGQGGGQCRSLPSRRRPLERALATFPVVPVRATGPRGTISRAEERGRSSRRRPRGAELPRPLPQRLRSRRSQENRDRTLTVVARCTAFAVVAMSSCGGDLTLDLVSSPSSVNDASKRDVSTSEAPPDRKPPDAPTSDAEPCPT